MYHFNLHFRLDKESLCRSEHLFRDEGGARCDELVKVVFSSVFPLLCLVFIQNLENTSKWGIREFFRDIDVNLALKLYKTLEKYAKNANKIHTCQWIPPINGRFKVNLDGSRINNISASGWVI